MTRIGCVVLVAGLSVIGLVAAAGDGQKPPLVNTLDNSREELAIFLSSLLPLRSPDKVVALPVTMIGDGLSAQTRVEERPVQLDGQEAQKVGAALASEDSYAGGVSACLFEPAVAFRFQRGPSGVQALVCFRCSELIFEDEAGRQRSGRMRLGANRSVLLAAAKRAFPNNPELSAFDK